MNEAEFISALRAIATSPQARGLADDAAVIEFGSETLVLTHDTMVESVHVLEGQDPADIAWKLVAVNLSDLAGKGAEPVGVLISHMLGSDDHRLVAGLKEVLETYDVLLLGGDTVRGDGARAWGCTAIGRACHSPVPARDGARPGDAIYLGGRIGFAMLGFEALRDDTDDDDSAYRRPVPQLALGRDLAPHVSAMMDISDGLLLDASRIANASSVTLAIERTLVAPLAPEDRLEDAMRWGDDYVLLCTGPAGLDAQFPVTRIGQVTAKGADPVILDGECPEGNLGYTH
ncbi:thiamine-phosphate kinase [Qipengyuania gelatinilytica]|uniref:Thiamine-monophosphate kinase n=1 Tax=Qipengyuania gelatinilytica TaxID=2867231 RepID=A0ABX9A3V7_9SPHN|nr:thiamine-phosphate kinase [Qipengyuania gelatinilytica]QZD95933.1 thiamine-phosphate kinase [Qipengyuania gelatinilytica]